MLKTKDGYAKVIGTSYQGSSDYLLLSNGDSKAISSLSVNYANNADKLDGEHASSFVRAGVIDTKDTDLNALDTFSFVKSVNSKVADHSPKGNNGWYNVIQLVHRNGVADGPSYIGQIALGMTTNTNDMFFRGRRTDSWKTVIHSGNIADQSVKYATNAGNADTLDKLHASAFLQLKNARFTQYNKGTWTKILKFTTPVSTIQASISFTWHPSECARNVWADFSINIRGGITFFVSWKGEERRTLMCVGTNNEYSVWVKGNKAGYDPYGVIQVTQTWDIISYETGSLAYSDTTPTGTYSAEASMRGYVLQADRLITSRNINGTAFNGTANITTSYWGTKRQFTIGGAIKEVNGSANVTWSLSEIGAAAADHTHPYLPLAGGEMNSGAQITRKAKGVSWVYGRDSALLKDTTSSGYHALWSLKTKEGSWEFGEFQNDINTDNVPVLTYITDTNYTNKKNTITYQQKFQLASGTIALTSQIPSSLPANGGNADTVDGYHAGGLFTAFGNENHNVTATVGGVTKKFQVNYASNSDKLDGYHANTGQTPYGYIPTIGVNGVMEIGKYIDFHNDNGGKYDYSTRLQSTGDHQNTLNLPSKSGTLALTSDIKDTNTWRPITDNYELGESGTSLSSLGSLTLYNDLLSAIPTIPTIPNPTDYYWANNKVSNKSTTDAIVQVNSIGAGCSTVFGSQQDGTVAATNWFRAVGKTGIYFQTYTGGLYMTDTSWVRTFNNKGLCIKNTVKSNDLQVMYKGDETIATSAAVLESATTLVYGTSTSSNSINTYLRGTNITLQVKKDTSINYNAFQVTADETRCFNYFNMKNGAEVSAGKFLVKATDSSSYNSSYINHSLVVSNSSINIATVNKVQYKEESISFQFGNGTYATNVGTATIFIPYGYTIKNIRWSTIISSNQEVKKVELINNDDTLSATLKATLLIGSIAGPANIDIYYYLYPDTVIKNLYNTNIPQLYLANNIAQIQYKDKFLSLTDSGLYINGTIYQQLNGYHKQPVFIASAIYNGTRWEYRGCEHTSIGIQCTTMIPNCSINNYLVIPVNVTITEVWLLANQCRIRFNDSSVKYRGIYVYYIGD